MPTPASLTRFAWAALPFLFDKGLQLSGLNNIYWAVIIWGSTALIFYWALHQSLAEWKGRPTWMTRNRSLIGFSILSIITIGLIACFIFWPVDRGFVSPVIRVLRTTAYAKDPKAETPFYVDVYFTVDGSVPVIEAPHNQGIVIPTSQLSSKDQDTNFRLLEAIFNVAPPEISPQYLPGQEPFLSVFPTGFITDNQLQEVESGSRNLYVMVAWQYRLQNSSTVYIKEYCGYFTGTFENIKICPGNHNGTFIYKGK